MSYPTIAATSNDTTNPLGGNTAHTIDLPSGIGAGDLLLAFVAWGEPSSGNVLTWTGWNALGTVNIGTAVDGYGAVYYRIASGSEGATSSASTPQPTRLAYVIHRIEGYAGTPATVFLANTNPFDPPNLISGFGAVDTLWFAFAAYSAGNQTVTSYPSGYSSGINETIGLIDSASIGVASKAATAASENPGAFATTSTGWISGATVAVQGLDDLVADFAYDADGLDVDFTDTSYGGTGTVDTWAWDFGDGATSTSQNPSNVYAGDGSYIVTLDIENDDGQVASVSRTILVAAGVIYEPPEPSNAVIEIRAAAVGAYRWGVAHWGESVWAAAGWVDVTPQSVDAVVRWGSHQPEAGILAETEAGSWIVDTYDPDRLLDPGNADSPYHADLRAGLPIRIRHRGTIVRQGICETIAYFYAGKRGGIRVTDNLSLMARTPVPDDTILSDTLRARARDVIAAAGLAVTVEPDPPSGDPALAPRLAGDRSVWRHVADAAEQTLHVAYIDRIGTLKFRAWASPYDRNRGVDGHNLVDVGTIVQTRGLYSVVQAQQTVGDGGALIERRLTPTPRYGAVTYKRSDPTPDADDWAAAVLADRSLQTVQWIPGEIYPLTADDVEYFATLEAMERFGVDHATATPPVDITGIIVGGEFRVTGKKDSAAVWSFQLELAQTADSPLYTDTDPAEFLLNETGDGYLYAD